MHFSLVISNKAGPTLPQSPSSADLKVPIKKWLRDIQMQRYGDLFLKRGFREVSDIVEMHEDDLNEMGVTLIAHQKVILRHICTEQEELKGQ